MLRIRIPNKNVTYIRIHCNLSVVIFFFCAYSLVLVGRKEFLSLSNLPLTELKKNTNQKRPLLLKHMKNDDNAQSNDKKKMRRNIFQQTNIYEWWSHINLLDTHFSYCYYARYRVADWFPLPAASVFFSCTATFQCRPRVKCFILFCKFLFLHSLFTHDADGKKINNTHEILLEFEIFILECVENLINYCIMTTIIAFNAYCETHFSE